jgi:ribonuclease HI
MYSLYFDGGSRGNPGVAGSGSVLYDKEGIEIASCFYYCGEDKTNNHAEYMALLKGIEMLSMMNIDTGSIVVRGDSKLVICQCNGQYKVSNPQMKELHSMIKEKLRCMTGKTKPAISEYFKSMIHVYRDQNKRADELSNKAMDSKSSKVFLISD